METPEFQNIKKENKAPKIPFFEMWKTSTGNIMAGMGARYIDGVFFNIFGVFSITYLTQTLKISRTDSLLGVMAAALVMCIFIPLFGYLSDRIGRTKVYWIGSLLTGCSAFPAFWLMANSGGSITVIWLSIIIPFGILYASIYGPEAALFAELFDARIRYTGISFVYQFSGIFASGITPMIATALLKMNDGKPEYIAMYVAFAGAVSAISALWIGSRKSKEAEQAKMATAYAEN